MEYEFTLKFMLAANAAEVDALVERLGAAGCEDALVGIGQPGRIALDFTREADSAQHAIISTLEAVKSASPGARLLEVTPDFVGLSDVAALVGVSRQNMRKLMLAHKDSFPVAIHEGTAALWHLFPVLTWLKDRAGYTISQSLIDVAY
ncbi:MAG: helix-turn-helix transcriptional regulator, partial [Gammaproteobacteria bacterium]